MAAEGDTIGRRIRTARQARRMTAKQVAEALGVSSNQMIKYETGANRITADRLGPLAAILGVSVLWLIPDDESALAALHGRFLKLSPVRRVVVMTAWEHALAEVEP